VFYRFWPHARAWSLNLAISNFFSSKEGDFEPFLFFPQNVFYMPPFRLVTMWLEFATKEKKLSQTGDHAQ